MSERGRIIGPNWSTPWFEMTNLTKTKPSQCWGTRLRLRFYQKHSHSRRVAEGMEAFAKAEKMDLENAEGFLHLNCGGHVKLLGMKCFGAFFAKLVARHGIMNTRQGQVHGWGFPMTFRIRHFGFLSRSQISLVRWNVAAFCLGRFVGAGGPCVPQRGLCWVTRPEKVIRILKCLKSEAMWY